MEKKTVVMVIVGIICLLSGVFLQFSGFGGGVSAEDKQACETAVQAKNWGEQKAEFLARCDSDVGFVAMMKAQQAGSGAQEAAQSIAAANQSEIGGGMLSMFLMGLGAVLTFGGLFVGKMAKKNA